MAEQCRVPEASNGVLNLLSSERLVLNGSLGAVLISFLSHLLHRVSKPFFNSFSKPCLHWKIIKTMIGKTIKTIRPFFPDTRELIRDL